MWGNKLDIELEGKLGLPNKKGGGEGKYHMDKAISKEIFQN